MLIGIEGGLGSGKTVQLVRYLNKDYYTGRKIYANLGLNDIDYEKIDIAELLNKEKDNLDFNNCTIGIDEITVFIDCRTSMAKRNRIFSYFVLQSRKRNVNVYYTTQSMAMLDKRLVHHTHIVIMCDFVYNENEEIIPNWRQYVVYDFRNPRKPVRNVFNMDISKYYELYDTDEIITPF